MMPILTERLILRDWRPDDRRAFAAMNADAKVMHFLGGPMPSASSDAMMERFSAEIAAEGFGIFAVEESASGQLAGMIGLHRIRPAIPIAPAVEIAWRLAAHVWGRGFATEGARACLAFGFDDIGLDEIVAYATASHAASRRVMEKIGLRRAAADDFDHPELAGDDPMRRHVVYRLKAEEWRCLQPGRRDLAAPLLADPPRRLGKHRAHAGLKDRQSMGPPGMTAGLVPHVALPIRHVDTQQSPTAKGERTDQSGARGDAPRVAQDLRTDPHPLEPGGTLGVG